MSDWRYLARRLDTNGGQGDVLNSDVPLTGVQITENLSAPGGLTGTISPVVANMPQDDGRPLLDEWITEIFAVKGDDIIGGGIVTHSGFDGPAWTVECTGH